MIPSPTGKYRRVSFRSSPNPVSHSLHSAPPSLISAAHTFSLFPPFTWTWKWKVSGLLALVAYVPPRTFLSDGGHDPCWLFFAFLSDRVASHVFAYSTQHVHMLMCISALRKGEKKHRPFWNYFLLFQYSAKIIAAMLSLLGGTIYVDTKPFSGSISTPLFCIALRLRGRKVQEEDLWSRPGPSLWYCPWIRPRSYPFLQSGDIVLTVRVTERARSALLLYCSHKWRIKLRLF